jgi:hypothetical protein
VELIRDNFCIFFYNFPYNIYYQQDFFNLFYGSEYPVTLERWGETTVAGPSAPKRKCPGGVASKTYLTNLIVIV